MAETSRAISTNLAILARGPHTTIGYREYVKGEKDSRNIEEKEQRSGDAIKSIRDKLKMKGGETS